jgi:hypothetical protein
MVGVDATVLTLLLNDRADSPPDPQTGRPVESAKERIEHLVETLHKAKQKIIIPTPVLGEVLVRAGAAGLAYLEILQKASVFEIRPFDTLAAVELALMTEKAITAGDKRGGRTEPWQKIKFDRQVVAICKVAGVATLYASDSMAHFAREAGMTVVGVHALPLPPAPPQLNLDFEKAAAGKQQGFDEEPSPEYIEPAEGPEHAGPPSALD